MTGNADLLLAVEAEAERAYAAAAKGLEIDSLLWFPRVEMRTDKRFNDEGTGFVIGHAVEEAKMREMVAALKWPHYVYTLCSASGAVFYVGKGVGLRMFQHRKEAESGVQSEKCRVIRRLGDRLRYGLFAACEDESWALMLESILINSDYDNLTNVRPGTPEAVVNAVYQESPLLGALRSIARTLGLLRKMSEDQTRVEEAFIRSYPFMADRLHEGRQPLPL